jgi:hypothetical protein
MYSLRSVGAMSCAKIMGTAYFCLGLIFVPFILLGGFVAPLLGNQSSQPLAGIAMWFLALLVPIVYGFMGFVMGALSAWVYNLAARWIGGIRLELISEGANSPSKLGLI